MTTPPARTGPPVVAGPWLEQALSQVVRTPLHSLLGFLELLAMSELDDDQRRLHDQLVGSAEDLLAGSDRLLWLVRLLGGHYRPRPARVHLAAFVKEIAAASDGVVSPVVAADAPAHVDTDLAALHQLVSELVDNARRHGGAPVVLAVGPSGNGRPGVRLTVSDGGTGLPAAAKRTLTSAAATPETGVGLLLIRRLADLLGAEVRLDPMPRHIGGQIALTLPPSLGDVPAPAAAAPSGSGAPGRPLRVLLVEDNATNRLLTQRQLTRLGHEMVAVASGREGVEAALAAGVDADRIDVVLMDRHLPDIDGCTAAEQIRAALAPDRAHLPIIAVTADATAEARDACAAAGMDEVLTKPVDLQQLSAALGRASSAIDGDAQLPPEDAVWLPETVRWIVSRVDGDPESAAELMATYLGELPGRRLRIQASLRRGEGRAVVAAAESLRTSSETIGARAVAGTCAALGAAAAAADLAAARSFLPSLMDQCQQVANELGAYTDPSSLEAALVRAG